MRLAALRCLDLAVDERNTWHGFLRLNDESSIAFVHNPEISEIPIEIGKTHAGNPGASCAPGAMQHFAMRVSNKVELLAMRDRLRAKGVLVLGPIDHGMCVSIYFAGPENLSLELSYSEEPINQEVWIDPEVVELAGITAEELSRFKKPAPFKDSGGAIEQPALNGSGPHMTNYPPGAYPVILAMPDEKVWSMVENEPPVKVEP